MKKGLILLLFFIVSCSGSDEENFTKNTLEHDAKNITATSLKKTTTTVKHSVGIDGLTVLYAGHSFGIPFAENLTKLAEFSGIEGHNQRIVFRGGENGVPQAMWKNPTVKSEIKKNLDDGNVDVVILICCSEELIESRGQSDQAIVEIIEYALSKNTETKFGLAMPWIDFPNNYKDVNDHRSITDMGYLAYTEFAKSLSKQFNDLEIFTFYHGAAVYELRKMFENGKLQDIKTLIGPKRTSIFTDQKGHAGDIAKDTGTLIWLKAIYDINPMDIPKIEKYESDIREIATRALRLTGK